MRANKKLTDEIVALKKQIREAERENASLVIWVERIKQQIAAMKESSVEVTIDNCADMLEQGAENIKNTGEAINCIMSHFDRGKK
ncbi:MAG TPA: hypothetical protein ENH82_18540 [bacterium]|nr:hypothetical protein [bacterium]